MIRAGQHPGGRFLSTLAGCVVFVAMILAGCTPWGAFTNPGDDDSDTYQGYIVVTSPDAVQPHEPADNFSTEAIPAEFLVSRLIGADAYQLQISALADFSGTPVFDKNDYLTHRFTVTGENLPSEGTWYWRARAHAPDRWGRWTTVRSFTMPQKYQVLYDGNGNTGGTVPVDSARYRPGELVQVASEGSLVKAGYDFVRWNTKADGTGTDHTPGTSFTMGSATVTLYAQWSKITYRVTYDGNGHTSGDVPLDSARYAEGASVSVKHNTGLLARTNYSFAGWNTKADGTGTDRVPDSIFSMGSADVVLYAKWTEPLVSMVSVPGGSFEMGSPAGTGYDDERPVHTVNLTGFLMSTYEVTQEQYRTVTGSSPSNFSGKDLPVEEVTWYDSVEFCNKLSEREDLTKVYTITGRSPATGYPITSASVTMDITKNGYRLPTEAEWEYAARGGNGSPGNYTYAGSNDLGSVAWYTSNTSRTTRTVGTKAANGLGLYDMTGNVWEWCWDWYGSYTSEAQNDPIGASSGTRRIVHGGSWDDTAGSCRSTFREEWYPDKKNSPIGFRLVRRP